MQWHWDDPIGLLREVLEDGGFLAIPSESSYGLGVDPRDARGVRAIYEVKGREAAKALPVMAADIGQIVALGVRGDVPELAVAASFWPAPLSILVPLASPIPAAAGLGSLAVRIPAHPRLRELLGRLGHALTATSANLSGHPPILDPRDLGPLLAQRKTAVIDDGILPGGPPSTLVDYPEGRLRVLRRGAFPVERLPSLVSSENADHQEDPR